MLEGLASTVASALAVPADAAVRTLASMLVVYCCTAIPLVFWAIGKITQTAKAGRSSTVAEKEQHSPAVAASTEGADLLPSIAQTTALIRARRSIFPKDFTGESIDRSVVEGLLECANWAPTHGRTEPWRFVVLGRRAQEQFMDLSLQVLERECTPAEFAKKSAKLGSKRAGPFQRVPYMLAIGMKRRALAQKEMPEWEETCAVAAAVQNIYLAATAAGVAGYWSSWYTEARDSADLKQFLGLEPEDRCLGVFMLGKAADTSAHRSKRGPIADKVSWRE